MVVCCTTKYIGEGRCTFETSFLSWFFSFFRVALTGHRTYINVNAVMSGMTARRYAVSMVSKVSPCSPNMFMRHWKYSNATWIYSCTSRKFQAPHEYIRAALAWSVKCVKSFAACSQHTRTVHQHDAALPYIACGMPIFHGVPTFHAAHQYNCIHAAFQLRVVNRSTCTCVHKTVYWPRPNLLAWLNLLPQKPTK